MTTTPSPGKSMSEALARLWTRFLPEIELRVVAVETAVAALTAGSLSHEQREAGHAAAHKLAGTLGTFGLAEGTTLARKAENLLVDTISEADLNDLTACALGLRAVLRSRISNMN